MAKELKTLQFSEGTDVSNPSIIFTPLTKYKTFANDAAYVAAKGSAAADGDTYYDTTNDVVKVYIDGAWTYLLDNISNPENSSGILMNVGIEATVNANALTIAFKQADGTTDPTTAKPFNVTVKTGDGAFALRTLTTSASITVPSTATLGHLDGVEDYIYVYALDNSGTLEPSISTSILNSDEAVNTTTISTGADDARGIYSTTGRTGKYQELIGRIKITQATAGTWASSPTQVTVGNMATINTNSSQSAHYTDANNDITLTSGKIILDTAAFTHVYDNGNLFRFTNSGTTFTQLLAIQPIQVSIDGAIWGDTANAQITAWLNDSTQIQESARSFAVNELIFFSVNYFLTPTQYLNFRLSAGAIRGITTVMYINFRARLSKEF